MSADKARSRIRDTTRRHLTRALLCLEDCDDVHAYIFLQSAALELRTDAISDCALEILRAVRDQPAPGRTVGELVSYAEAQTLQEQGYECECATGNGEAWRITSVRS